MDKKPHPAKFTDSIIETLRKTLHEIDAEGLFLDPFAGTGKIHLLSNEKIRTIGIEIEPEWACYDPRTIIGDALRLPFGNATFQGIVTSPNYGTRMSDSFNAKDTSKRYTYHHSLGRKPTKGSSSVMQWTQPRYKEFHQNAWRESLRVLEDGGLFLLNISDHFRLDVEQPVTAWHEECLESLGIVWQQKIPINTPRQKHGANRKRSSNEWLLVGQKASLCLISPGSPSISQTSSLTSTET